MKAIRTDEITGIWSYLATVDWTDPWFLGLGCFHLMCAAATYTSRRHLTVQGIVFAIFLVLVGCSEYINQFAANNWKKFSRQQYFDSSGLFISIVFSMPILINCLVMVVMWLKTSADLMSNIRRKQLQQNVRQQREGTADTNQEQTNEAKDDASKSDLTNKKDN